MSDPASVSRSPAVTRHLGLDLGATNLKWTVVERDGDTWNALDRGQVRTAVAGGPDAIVAQLGQVGLAAMTTWPGVATAGVGIPGLYDPRNGTTRFLVNIPGDWSGRPVAAPVAAVLGLPIAMINDARAFGLAELRLGAARGASSMVGLTLGTGVGGTGEVRHAGHRRLVVDAGDEVVRSFARRPARAVGDGDERRREGLELEQRLLELLLRGRRLRREEFERRARAGREDVDDLGHTVGKGSDRPGRAALPIGPVHSRYRARRTHDCS